MTNSIKLGDKPSGSVTTFMRNFMRGVKQGEVKVPCGSCTACCRSPHVLVELDQAEAEHCGGVWSEERARMVLPKKADGSCVYLVDDKCSIYSERPLMCRTYDCRHSLLGGKVWGGDPVMLEAYQQWAPMTMPTVEDKAVLIATRLAILDDPASDFTQAMTKATGWRKYYPLARIIISRCPVNCDSEMIQWVLQTLEDPQNAAANRSLFSTDQPESVIDRLWAGMMKLKVENTLDVKALTEGKT
jgi:Fe-S-cluster containining protein